MVAKSNAIFLGFSEKEKVAEDGLIFKNHYFSFLVFDVEGTSGLVNPRIMTCGGNLGSDFVRSIQENVPKMFGRCIVDLDIYINVKTKEASVRIVGVQNGK